MNRNSNENFAQKSKTMGKVKHTRTHRRTQHQRAHTRSHTLTSKSEKKWIFTYLFSAWRICSWASSIFLLADMTPRFTWFVTTFCSIEYPSNWIPNKNKCKRKGKTIIHFCPETIIVILLFESKSHWLCAAVFWSSMHWMLRRKWQILCAHLCPMRWTKIPFPCNFIHETHHRRWEPCIRRKPSECSHVCVRATTMSKCLCLHADSERSALVHNHLSRSGSI